MPARVARSAIAGPTAARLGRRRRRRLAPIAACAGLAALMIAAGAIAHLTPVSPRLALAEGLERAASAAGFTIDRVEIRGHEVTTRTDILKALAVLPGTSQLAFEEAAALQRIEALPWVKSARIERLLPDGITIEISERRPVVLWREASRDVLLDATGRELAELPPGSDVGLPIVTGARAGIAGPELIAALSHQAELSRRTIEARRIEERRWTLQLMSGALLHLPAEGTAGALAWSEAQAATGLLDLPVEAIDLRVGGQLVVRGGLLPAARSNAAETQSLRAAAMEQGRR